MFEWTQGPRDVFRWWSCQAGCEPAQLEDGFENAAIAHTRQTGHPTSWGRTETYQILPLRTAAGQNGAHAAPAGPPPLPRRLPGASLTDPRD